MSWLQSIHGVCHAKMKNVKKLHGGGGICSQKMQESKAIASGILSSWVWQSIAQQPRCCICNVFGGVG
jgi:hypothetical protein